jgi:DNA polymerase III epsilon subunit-like protein
MPFAKVNKMDLMDLLFYWFESLDEPRNFRLDTMRGFFGIKASQAHEAYSDTVDTAKLLVQFLKFHRRQANVGKFKGSMKGG